MKGTIRLSKEFSFEMAHALFGYDGKCKNIHGHSYKLTVTLIGEPINDPLHVKHGMLIDFSDLKALVKKHILDIFDHALVLNGNSPHKYLVIDGHDNEKVLFADYQPTCENLILDFSERIEKTLPKGMKLYALKLRETNTSYVEWFAEDNRH